MSYVDGLRCSSGSMSLWGWRSSAVIRRRRWRTTSLASSSSQSHANVKDTVSVLVLCCQMAHAVTSDVFCSRIFLCLTFDCSMRTGLNLLSYRQQCTMLRWRSVLSALSDTVTLPFDLFTAVTLHTMQKCKDIADTLYRVWCQFLWSVPFRELYRPWRA